MGQGPRRLTGPQDELVPGCRQRPRQLLWALAAVCFLGFAPASAQSPGAVPDITVRLVSGRSATLSELWASRPLLLALFYTRCVGVCSPYLLSLAETVAAQGGAGTAYDLLALSFDPADDAAAVAAYAARFGLDGRAGWNFATANAEDITALAAAIGFWFKPDTARGQFDHPALTVAIRDGRVVRALEGIPVNARAFRETLWELRGNFVPTYAMPGQNTLLSCFEYDAVTGKARPNWGLLLLVMPALVALAACVVIFAFAPRRPDSAPR
ncbi:MAG: SCO family protein [Gammaproteobacteria bacterium]|nr:SCO family protein [Gammaproteobacteria bacterium]